ncbi:MAG: bacteriohemerythrin [Spirochaetaceae bacterium]|jgi:hemerythrin|nr:bacteriohemerythrin [Spirochaetaceae bacterium]
MTEEAFIVWDDRYVIGIPVVDEQHKALLKLTNELYEACRRGDAAAREEFKDTIRRTVDYVKFHFSDEEKILERVKYPKIGEQKHQHECFVRKVLEDVKNFENGKTFVPNQFVRFLRDWILEHIAVADKEYAEYILRLKKEGHLTGV